MTGWGGIAVTQTFDFWVSSHIIEFSGRSAMVAHFPESVLLLGSTAISIFEPMLRFMLILNCAMDALVFIMMMMFILFHLIERCSEPVSMFCWCAIFSVPTGNLWRSSFIVELTSCGGEMTHIPEGILLFGACSVAVSPPIVGTHDSLVFVMAFVVVLVMVFMF